MMGRYLFFFVILFSLPVFGDSVHSGRYSLGSLERGKICPVKLHTKQGHMGTLEMDPKTQSVRYVPRYGNEVVHFNLGDLLWFGEKWKGEEGITAQDTREMAIAYAKSKKWDNPMIKGRTDSILAEWRASRKIESIREFIAQAENKIRDIKKNSKPQEELQRLQSLPKEQWWGQGHKFNHSRITESLSLAKKDYAEVAKKKDKISKQYAQRLSGVIQTYEASLKKIEESVVENHQGKIEKAKSIVKQQQDEIKNLQKRIEISKGEIPAYRREMVATRLKRKRFKVFRDKDQDNIKSFFDKDSALSNMMNILKCGKGVYEGTPEYDFLNSAVKKITKQKKAEKKLNDFLKHFNHKIPETPEWLGPETAQYHCVFNGAAKYTFYITNDSTYQHHREKVIELCNERIMLDPRYGSVPKAAKFEVWRSSSVQGGEPYLFAGQCVTRQKRYYGKEKYEYTKVWMVGRTYRELLISCIASSRPSMSALEKPYKNRVRVDLINLTPIF